MASRLRVLRGRWLRGRPSGLWEPDKALPIDGLPTYGAALKAHGARDTPFEEIERLFRNNEENRLYDE